MKKLLYAGLAAVLLLPVFSPVASENGLPLDTIKLPPGFGISLYAADVPAARSLAVGTNGTVFVGTKESTVYALPDNNKDGRADEVIKIATGLNKPAGVAFYNGSLYVAEINRVLRYDNIENRLSNPPQPVIITDTLPRDMHHGFKYLRIGPDRKLYIPVGVPCNVCLKSDWRYGTILRLNLDGSGLELVARGIRNSVGFDFHPLSGELWFTDNGRDRLGDNKPPDELNRISARGQHFGFPYVHGKDVTDPDYGARKPADLAITAPAQELGPHVAALGMRFYTGSSFPAGYRNNIFIAEHGSWNRTVPIGYRITLVRLRNNTAAGYEVFAEGWLVNGRAWGRPVDVLVPADGSLLVSDDAAGVIYRIAYGS
ncbi:MAG: sorbosone dehydrogenase family protein [Spirochaetales bacterium]|nr:sorbosone dehydrogenase family protein [Spirochaetales bacterium]